MDFQPTEPHNTDPSQSIFPDVQAAMIENPNDATNETWDGFNSLDPRNRTLDQIGGLIVSVVLTIAFLIGLGVLWFNVGIGPLFWAAAIGGLILIALAFIGSLAWPVLSHRHASWRLDAEGLEIRRGVIWRHQITIPLGRVQHADVSQGPFQRYFEIGTLTVYTAGTQNASITLEGLGHATAIEIRDRLVRQRKDQNVV